MDFQKEILSNGLRAMKYTCVDYRSEMKLLGLKRRLKEDHLTKKERAQIVQEIKELEKEMQMN
ncbi:MAG: hypothetical protein ACQEQO_05315 [Thermodesulfobacteriota bacterium]